MPLVAASLPPIVAIPLPFEIWKEFKRLARGKVIRQVIKLIPECLSQKLDDGFEGKGPRQITA
jgi:hypothetical protein